MAYKKDNNSAKEQEKTQAALKAAKEFIYDDFVLGIGTGNTVKYFIRAISELIEKNSLDIILVPSSLDTQLELTKAGLSYSSLLEFPELDVYVDSADIVTKDYVLVKGGGAALTKEKTMAKAAKEFIVIVDDSKYPRDLLSHPVPVELLPFAINTIVQPIFNLGGEFELRYGKGKIGPIITDNGNCIGDISFSNLYNPAEMEVALNNIPGIIENGLFVSYAHRIIIGHKDDAEIIDLM
ncbi:MAG: ribose-5-phosphate isomerase RpiA [Candidatus Thorarchaeota archaeon]